MEKILKKASEETLREVRGGKTARVSQLHGIFEGQEAVIIQYISDSNRSSPILTVAEIATSLRGGLMRGLVDLLN